MKLQKHKNDKINNYKYITTSKFEFLDSRLKVVPLFHLHKNYFLIDSYWIKNKKVMQHTLISQRIAINTHPLTSLLLEWEPFPARLI